MMSVCYISRLSFRSQKANVYNTAKTCEALSLAGARVTLISSDDGAVGVLRDAFLERNNLRSSFEIVSLRGRSNRYRFGGVRSNSVLEVLFANFSLMGELWRRRKSMDLVYFRDPFVIFVVLFARFILHKPVFFEAHAVLVGRRNKKVGDMLARLSTGVIAITHALAAYYRTYADNVIVSFCAAAEPERFAAVSSPKRELRERLKLPAEALMLGYTGNLTRTGNNDSYGLEDIISALPYMPENTIFVGVGKKSELETAELEQLAKRLGVASRVHFIPFVPKEKVAEYLLACDILLIPAAGARIGNAPTKMFDYLVSGRPIVAARTVAIEEVLINHTNALLVEYKNPHAWAEAVALLEKNSELRERLINQAKSDGARYTWKGRGETIYSFLTKSMQKRSRSTTIISLRRLAIFFLHYTGINTLLRLCSRHRIYLIGYHSIGDRNAQNLHNEDVYPYLTIDRKDFEAQISLLAKNGHTFIPLEKLHDPETRRLRRPTVIYFDDGFKNVMTNALPILTQYRIPAVIFATIGLIDRSITKLPSFLIDAADSSFAEKVFLSWSDIRDLSKKGFLIGAHGDTHTAFTKVSGEALVKELQIPKLRLEKELGQPVTTLSYPHGRHNEVVVEAAKALGYTLAIGTIEGTNNERSIRERPLQLRKIAPKPHESLTTFTVKLYSGNILTTLQKIWS